MKANLKFKCLSIELLMIGMVLSALIMLLPRTSIAGPSEIEWRELALPTGLTPGVQTLECDSNGTATMTWAFSNDPSHFLPSAIFPVSTTPLMFGTETVGEQQLSLISGSDLEMHVKVTLKFGTQFDRVDFSSGFVTVQDDLGATFKLEKAGNKLAFSIENVNVNSTGFENWLNQNTEGIRNFFNLPSFDLPDRQTVINKLNLYEYCYRSPPQQIPTDSGLLPPDSPLNLYNPPYLPIPKLLQRGSQWSSPEPATVCLLGLGGLALLRKRNNQSYVVAKERIQERRQKIRDEKRKALFIIICILFLLPVNMTRATIVTKDDVKNYITTKYPDSFTQSLISANGWHESTWNALQKTETAEEHSYGLLQVNIDQWPEVTTKYGFMPIEDDLNWQKAIDAGVFILNWSHGEAVKNHPEMSNEDQWKDALQHYNWNEAHRGEAIWDLMHGDVDGYKEYFPNRVPSDGLPSQVTDTIPEPNSVVLLVLGGLALLRKQQSNTFYCEGT